MTKLGTSSVLFVLSTQHHTFSRLYDASQNATTYAKEEKEIDLRKRRSFSIMFCHNGLTFPHASGYLRIKKYKRHLADKFRNYMDKHGNQKL